MVLIVDTQPPPAPLPAHAIPPHTSPSAHPRKNIFAILKDRVTIRGVDRSEIERLFDALERAVRERPELETRDEVRGIWYYQNPNGAWRSMTPQVDGEQAKQVWSEFAFKDEEKLDFGGTTVAVSYLVDLALSARAKGIRRKRN